MSTTTHTLETPRYSLRTSEPATDQAAKPTHPEFLSHFAPLLEKLLQARRRQCRGLALAFTAVEPGHGVTFVVETLAWMMSQSIDEPVLVTSPAALSGDVRAPLRAAEPFGPQKVWRLSNGRHHSTASPSWDSLEMIRERFGFVLVDCPPVRDSSEIYSACSMSDGVILVVAAGQAKAREVEDAQRLLKTTAAPFLGLVLNKRRDATPDLLSRFL